MNSDQREWARARDELVSSVIGLGFPQELGNEIAKNLGSPKAMRRMTAYLGYVKPKKAEIMVDEMLAIMSEIETWREKKTSQEANARYNEFMYYGIDGEEEG